MVNDICRQHLGLAFSLHVQAALAQEIPLSDVLAVIRFIAPYVGYPACADALARLNAIAADRGFDIRAAALAETSATPDASTPGPGPARIWT